MQVRRYSFVITDKATGAERRLGIAPWPTLVVMCAVGALPVLAGFGARWRAHGELQELTATTIALRAENDSYRAATGQLAAQISTLQGAVDDIGARAAVDPAASRAMERLPSSVKSRAMGGGSAASALVGAALNTPDRAFGVLRELLGGIEDRLALMRSGIERRRALAGATPSLWPVTGWLSSSYGTRRDPFTGGEDFHPGLDISAPQGEPIVAPADGRVASAGVNGNYGNLVVLDHGFGIVTKFGHLSRFAVAGGQKVERGQVLGFVGTTGRSTSPHLHYEIWVNGQLTNPLRLLATR